MSAEGDLLSFCRRLIRTPFGYYGINVEFSMFSQLRGNARLVRLQHSLLEELARRYRGQVFVMANTDAFVLIRSDMAASAEVIKTDILRTVLKDPEVKEDQTRRLVHDYTMPDRYNDFRERVEEYMQPDKRPKENMFDAETGEYVPDVPLEGVLNGAMLVRIEHLIRKADIKPFLKKQDVFVFRPDTGWWPVFEERFVSLTELQRKFFPDVELRRADPLFNQLCRALDEKLLHHLLVNRAKISHKISVNISVETVFDQLMLTFAENLDAKERENIIFEINRSEIFQDISQAIEAIKWLQEHHFSVAIDGLSLDLLPFIRAERLKTELIKIHLQRDHIRLLRDEDCLKALRRLPIERIVFSRCDHEGAIQAGQTLGISMFQGWLVDEIATQTKKR
jgi:EAL domain-containing protein (putative c-di-GMP-specific phosphodiesterase class I)